MELANSESPGGRSRHRDGERSAEQLVARNVQRVRKLRGLQAAAVAERLGMTAPSYSRLESGSRRIRVDELMSVALALSVSPSVLMVPWDDDGLELAITLRGGAEVHTLGTRADGADRVRAPHDFIIGRLNPLFTLSVNPEHFTATGPAAVVDDELAADRYARLEQAGWRIAPGGRTVTSPGGIRRTEVEEQGDPPASKPGKRKRSASADGASSGEDRS